MVDFGCVAGYDGFYDNSYQDDYLGDSEEWRFINRRPPLSSKEYWQMWSELDLNYFQKEINKMAGYSIDLSKKKTVSPVCRGSYVNILEPRALPNSEKMAWGIQCLFPKSDPDVVAWVKDLKSVFAQVLIDKFGMDKAKKLAATIKTPIRDGDAPEEADKELQGYYFVNSNNQFRQPYIIGAMGKAVDPATLTVDDIYSGAWYRVMLEFWYYDKAGNKGISSSVAAIMKVKDDENLGSGTTKSEASSAFSGFASEVANMMGDSDDAEPSEDQTKKEADAFSFL